MENKNIFDISAEYAEIENLLYEAGGEISEELEQRLHIAEDQLQAKSEGYYALIMKNRHEADMIDAIIKSYTAKKKTRENAVEQLKDRLHEAMKFNHVKKLPLPAGSITLCEREAIDIVDEELIPESYKTTVTTIKIEKAEINKAVKEGQEVPGTEKSITTYLLIK